MSSQPFQLHTQIKGSGFPILCLHGHPGSAESLSVFTNPLSQKFQTIAPDLRGYGKSRYDRPFAMTEHIDDLTHLLDQHHIDQCLVLGWSLGGILAMELALRLPARITGLILVATAARPISDHPAITGEDYLYTGIASIVNWFNPGWKLNIELFGQRSLYRYLIQQHTTTAYEYLAREGLPAYLQTCKSATSALNQALQKRYDRRHDLPNIQCPSLVLMGDCDRHITSASSLETAQALQNCQWHNYPNTAHLFPWEIPAQVITDIDRWLQAKGYCI